MQKNAQKHSRVYKHLRHPSFPFNSQTPWKKVKQRDLRGAAVLGCPGKSQKRTAGTLPSPDCYMSMMPTQGGFPKLRQLGSVVGLPSKATVRVGAEENLAQGTSGQLRAKKHSGSPLHSQHTRGRSRLRLPTQSSCQHNGQAQYLSSPGNFSCRNEDVTPKPAQLSPAQPLQTHPQQILPNMKTNNFVH